MKRICIIEDDAGDAIGRYKHLVRPVNENETGRREEYEVHVVLDPSNIKERFIDSEVGKLEKGEFREDNLFDRENIHVGLDNIPEADVYLCDGLRRKCFEIADKFGKDMVVINSGDSSIMDKAREEDYAVLDRPSEEALEIPGYRRERRSKLEEFASAVSRYAEKREEEMEHARELVERSREPIPETAEEAGELSYVGIGVNLLDLVEAADIYFNSKEPHSTDTAKIRYLSASDLARRREELGWKLLREEKGLFGALKEWYFGDYRDDGVPSEKELKRKAYECEKENKGKD